MSVQAMAWALKRARAGDLTAPQNHLLLVLANYADHEGGDAFPGATTLAAETGMTVRGIRNILQQLEGLGVIRRGNQAITAAKNYPYGQRPTVWNLSMMQMELPLAEAATNEPCSPPPGTVFTREPCSPVNQTSGTGEPGSHDPSITIKPSSLRSEGLGAQTEIDARCSDERSEKPTRTRNGTRLPDDWEPDADGQAFAFNLIGDEIATEFDKFRDYWRSVPGAKGRKQDWPATWRNWIRRAAEDLARHPPRTDHDSPRRSPADNSAVGRIRRNVEAAERRERTSAEQYRRANAVVADG